MVRVGPSGRSSSSWMLWSVFHWVTGQSEYEEVISWPGISMMNWILFIAQFKWGHKLKSQKYFLKLSYSILLHFTHNHVDILELDIITFVKKEQMSQKLIFCLFL